ncbi:MAG: hypothetical protein K0S47_2967 [Herbinix sp.]|nr:hypothetical protein [Herbinix sp.]
MKKLALGTLLLLCILSMAGCKRRDIILTTDEISENTMVIKRNGGIQVAIVEGFDKDYYSLSELEEFVTKEVTSYNERAGSDEVAIDDLQIKDNNAIMLLSYSGMQHYTNFNEVYGAFFQAGQPDTIPELPDTYINVKEGTLTAKKDALSNKDYRVLVVKEAFDIKVSGKIKYYSDNAVLGEDNMIQSPVDELTVIVYKP